jgi:hypothetical protein
MEALKSFSVDQYIKKRYFYIRKYGILTNLYLEILIYDFVDIQITLHPCTVSTFGNVHAMMHVHIL